MMRLMKNLSFENFKKYIVDIFLPNRCPFCGKVIKWNENSCEECGVEIPFINTEHCKKCGQENCICNETEIHYDGCVSIVDYSGIVKDGIIRFKVDKAINLVDVFKDMISKRLLDIVDISKIDIVTSVPMHKSTKRVRRYNQADIIAKTVSNIINKPRNTRFLTKLNNIAQHELNSYERARAVKGLFSANEKCIEEVNGKVMLLCDDIITTGSTLNECARILKENGAKAVYCFTLASTRLDK